MSIVFSKKFIFKSLALAAVLGAVSGVACAQSAEFRLATIRVTVTVSNRKNIGIMAARQGGLLSKRPATARVKSGSAMRAIRSSKWSAGAGMPTSRSATTCAAIRQRDVKNICMCVTVAAIARLPKRKRRKMPCLN